MHAAASRTGNTDPDPPRGPRAARQPRPVAGNVVLLEWTADAGRSRVEDGLTTIVFRHGLIAVETAAYTLLRARG